MLTFAKMIEYTGRKMCEFVRVVECEHGPPSCPTCSGRSSETDVTDNCEKKQCKSTLVSLHSRYLATCVSLFTNI